MSNVVQDVFTGAFGFFVLLYLLERSMSLLWKIGGRE